MCLDVLPANTEGKICEKCFKKHSFSSRFPNYQKHTNDQAAQHLQHQQQQHGHHQPQRDIEHRCNICKTYIVSASKLQEHLIEHSFKGCEEHGYSCYICSAVFTVSSGLQLHMDELHGNGSKPYDCNLCPAKFFFRAELENHLIEHENGRIKIMVPSPLKDDAQRFQLTIHSNNNNNNVNNNNNKIIKCESEVVVAPVDDDDAKPLVPKSEVLHHEEDEEYIEVEKDVEPTAAAAENTVINDGSENGEHHESDEQN